MSNFIFLKTNIQGIVVVQSKKYEDERGYFCETFHEKEFAENLTSCNFVQDNESFSHKGVLRGLHYQYPHMQDKLIGVSQGRIFDVAVDLRKDSPTYGRYYSIILTEDNHRQLFVPKGCAHGFLTLSDTAKVHYKCTEVYYPDEQLGIPWNDPAVSIQWPLDELGELILNARDRNFTNLYTNKIVL